MPDDARVVKRGVGQAKGLPRVRREAMKWRCAALISVKSYQPGRQSRVRQFGKALLPALRLSCRKAADYFSVRPLCGVVFNLQYGFFRPVDLKIVILFS